MRLFFADDSKQDNPSREGMGRLVAIGGISVLDSTIRLLEQEINSLCTEFGFPERSEFKWSPSQGNWMHSNLIEEDRHNFYLRVLALAEEYEVKAIVVIEDTSCRTATGISDPFLDATSLLLERINHHFRGNATEGIIIADRPGGGSRAEETYLEHFLEILLTGTDYVTFNQIAHNVLTTHSHLSRLLQLADLITSCSVARVAGESIYSPPIFKKIKPLLYSQAGRIGGSGLKIHPDYRYVNLYHWLLGDTFFLKDGERISLPNNLSPYHSNPTTL